MAPSHDPKLTCQRGSCTDDPFLAAEAASAQPRIFEYTAAHSHLTSSGDYTGPSLAELWGRTSKMSHDSRWRDPWLCTGRDSEGRWLWRLVRRPIGEMNRRRQEAGRGVENLGTLVWES